MAQGAKVIPINAAPKSGAEDSLPAPSPAESPTGSQETKTPPVPESPTDPEESFQRGVMPLSCYVQGGRLACVTINPITFQLLRTSVKVGPCSDGPVVPGHDKGLDNAVEHAKARLMTICNADAQKQAAEALVTRARCGDQNAMAMIALIGKNAPHSDRAASAYQFIKAYVEKNPLPAFNGEDTSCGTPLTTKPLYPASLNMANGPALTRGHVTNMMQTFGGKRSRHRKLLMAGMLGFSQEDKLDKFRAGLNNRIEQALVDLGQTIGRARAIQLARMGNIAALSPLAAWELGG